MSSRDLTVPPFITFLQARLAETRESPLKRGATELIDEYLELYFFVNCEPEYPANMWRLQGLRQAIGVFTSAWRTHPDYELQCRYNGSVEAMLEERRREAARELDNCGVLAEWEREILGLIDE